MNCSTPGFPICHELLEPTQTHVCWVIDAIQPSHPLSSPSPPDFNPSQHQGLFQWVNLCIRWPKDWSFSFSRISDRVFKVGRIHYQWRCLVHCKHSATEQSWSLPPSCPPGDSLLHCWPQVAQAGSRCSSSSATHHPLSHCPLTSF